MYRVLHVLHGLSGGGITKWLVDLLTRMDRSRFSFDFAVHREMRCPYLDLIDQYGCRIYRLPNRINIIRYLLSFDQLLRSAGPYHVVHCHYHGFSAFPLLVARVRKVPVRIAHLHKDNPFGGGSHTPRRSLARQCLVFLLRHACTHAFACSERAAQVAWGESWKNDSRFRILTCGVTTSPFDQSVQRHEIKRLLGLEDCFPIVGHVGNFNPQKNHEFLIEVFRHVAARAPQSALLLIGDGQLRDRIQQLVAMNNLTPHVHFLGFRRDVNDLWPAMDVLMMPSLLEGFPITVIEAQFAHVPVLASHAIPTEANITGNVHFLSLSTPPEIWAKVLLEIVSEHHTWPSQDDLKMRRYTIDYNVELLSQVYSASS